MKAIKIDVEKRKIYEVEISDSSEINMQLCGGKETAHRFKTGDVLYVNGDGAFSDLGCFTFGSKKYGYEKLYGHGLILFRARNNEWSSTSKQINQIRRVVRFLKSNE